MQHLWCDAPMVFTDAKTVIIDEKEVKSIVLQDGGVLYGETTTPIEEVYLISLQTNKTVLSAKNNDSCILNATVLDDDNNPVENQEVTFKNGTTILDTILTNENGEAAYEYISRGLGDISIKAEINSLSSNIITIEDCFETISSPNRTGFSTSWHPKPLEITGKVATNGPWGGTRIYGGDGQNINIHYVFLSQNSSNSGESEQIRYNLTTTAYVPFKIVVDENKISLWMNSSLYSEKTLTTSPYVYMSGGSSANPVSLSDIKIKSLLGGNSLSLTSNKSALSYIDNDFCILTATYQGVSVNNKPITFKINDKVVKTTTTNNEGVAEYRYISRGIGDLVVTAECGELAETINIEDYLDYDALTSETNKWTKDSGTTVSYASTGATVRNSSWGAFKYSTVLTAPTEIEYEMVSAENTAFGYVGLWTNISDGNTNQFQYHLTSGNQLVCDKDSSTYNLSDYRGVYNIKIYSDHIEIHKDGTQIKSYNISLTNVYFVFTPAPNRNNVIKGFKVNLLPFDGSLSVSASKDILSYADEDECVLTATLLDDSDNPVSGETITFKNSSTVLGTDVTDSNGEATYTYESQGVGDVTITAECMNLQETYELEDCIYFHDMTSADSSHWTIPANANASYSSNGMKFSGASFCDAYLEVPLTKPYSVEFDLTEWSGSPNFLQYLWDSTKTTRHINTGYNNSKTSFDVYPNADNSFNGSIPQGSHIKIEIGNDVCKLYVDDTLKLTKSYTMPSSSILGLAKSGSCPITRKNIKIKPLLFDGSLSVSANKDILSYADNDSCTLTATLTGDDVANRPVVFKNGSTVLDTVNTDSNGVATYTYNSEGVGDVTFTVECMNLQETYVIEDCIDYDNAMSDKSSKYASAISLRNNGNATLSYDSNNYYKLIVSTAGESFIPINSLTGLNDFVLEFDTQINYNDAYGNGVALYDSNSNWASVYQHMDSLTHSKQVNGSFTYGSESTSVPSNTWVHYKITVTSNSVNMKLYNGETLIKEYSESYSHIAFSNTKFGFSTLWSNGRTSYVKNIKIKPL